MPGDVGLHSGDTCRGTHSNWHANFERQNWRIIVQAVNSESYELKYGSLALLTFHSTYKTLFSQDLQFSAVSEHVERVIPNSSWHGPASTETGIVRVIGPATAQRGVGLLQAGTKMKCGGRRTRPDRTPHWLAFGAGRPRRLHWFTAVNHLLLPTAHGFRCLTDHVTVQVPDGLVQQKAI
jgi:hypothetical protein